IGIDDDGLVPAKFPYRPGKLVYRVVLVLLRLLFVGNEPLNFPKLDGPRLSFHHACSHTFSLVPRRWACARCVVPRRTPRCHTPGRSGSCAAWRKTGTVRTRRTWVSHQLSKRHVFVGKLALVLLCWCFKLVEQEMHQGVAGIGQVVRRGVAVLLLGGCDQGGEPFGVAQRHLEAHDRMRLWSLGSRWFGLFLRFLLEVFFDLQIVKRYIYA